MSMKHLKAIGRWAGYIAFFVLCVLVFSRMVFPTASLRDFVTMRLAEVTGATKVTLGDVSLTGLIPSGAALENVELELPGVKVKTEKDDKITPPRLIVAEELRGSVSLWALAGGRVDASFEGKIQDGTLTGGHVAMAKGTPFVLGIERMEGIALGTERLFQALTGFDVTGVLSGNLDITVPNAEKDGRDVLQWDQMSGSARIEIGHGILHEPLLAQRDMRIMFSDAKLGTLKIGLKAEPGQGATAAPGAPAGPDGKAATARPGRKSDATFLSIEQLELTGGDVEIVVAPRGGVQFLAGQAPKDATINIHLGIRVADAYIDREVDDPKHPGKKVKNNTGIRTVAYATLQKKGHLQDGQFGLAITGTLGNPKVDTERPRVRVGGGSAGRKLNVDQPGGAEPGTGGDDEGAAEDPARPAKRGTRADAAGTPHAGRPGAVKPRRPVLDPSKLPPGALQPPPFPDFGPAGSTPPGTPAGGATPTTTPPTPTPATPTPARPDGVPHDGVPHDGVPPDGAPPEGTPTEGAPPGEEAPTVAP